MVESRLGAAPAHDDSTGAVPEDVGVRVFDGCNHTSRHFRRSHAQLRVHAGDHHVETSEQLLVLVQLAVIEYVDLDTGEQAERYEGLVQLRHHVDLAAQLIGTQAIGDGQPGAVIGEDQVVAPELCGGARHFLYRAATV